MINALVAGLAVGLGAAVVSAASSGLGLAVGEALVAGLVVGLVTGQVPTVKFTEFVLTCQGRGRVNFLRLLEDGLDRQVLRQAGTVYQFRHAALQAQLAGMYYQPPTMSGQT